MGLNVTMLRSSFELVIGRAPNLTHRFYEILFANHPEAKPLFSRKAAEQQEKMLTSALVAVLDHLEDAPWLVEQLGALGKKHVEYGVTEAMYPWVGEALLATLAEVAAAEWTPALASEWGAAYGAITSLMLAGTKPAT